MKCQILSLVFFICSAHAHPLNNYFQNRKNVSLLQAVDKKNRVAIEQALKNGAQADHISGFDRIRYEQGAYIGRPGKPYYHYITETFENSAVGLAYELFWKLANEQQLIEDKYQQRINDYNCQGQLVQPWQEQEELEQVAKLYEKEAQQVINKHTQEREQWAWIIKLLEKSVENSGLDEKTLNELRIRKTERVGYHSTVRYHKKPQRYIAHGAMNMLLGLFS